MKEALFSKEFFIAGLISRKLCTILSTEEATTLAAWEAENPANQQLAAALTDIDLIRHALPEINKFNAKTAYDRVIAMIRLQGQAATIADAQ